jgi:hypothetical protein
MSAVGEGHLDIEGFAEDLVDPVSRIHDPVCRIHHPPLPTGAVLSSRSRRLSILPLTFLGSWSIDIHREGSM